MRLNTYSLGAFWLAIACACNEPTKAPVVQPPQKPSPAPVVVALDAGTVPQQPEAPSAVVLEMGGLVQVKRPGSNEWVALKVGDALRQGDELRTSADGFLQFGADTARMKVHEDSEVTLTFLAAKSIRAKVKGYAESDVTLGQGQISLQADGSDAVADTSGGKFFFYADGKGLAQVTSLSGKAKLSANGREMQLKVGELSRAGTGGIQRARKSKTVMLAVAWPPQTETNRKVFPIKGKVDVGSRVTVQGRRVEPGPDGTFLANVPLKPGLQTVTVATIDPFGRRKADRRQITMDPNAPDIRGQVEYQ